LKEGTEDNILN